MTKYGLKLCTFEVATHLGRHSRIGALKDGRITDLNFATAWYMAQTGEAEPQRLADGIVPRDMLEFWRAGLRALHTAEELFLGAGPHPADWWTKEHPPRGPNNETLVYTPGEVRLLPPLAGRRVLGDCGQMPAGECAPRIAAIMDTDRKIGGYTLIARCDGYAVMGPVIATVGGVSGKLELTVRVNGEVRAVGEINGFERDIKSTGDAVPGDLFERGFAALPVSPGDMVELETAQIGILRARIAKPVSI